MGIGVARGAGRPRSAARTARRVAREAGSFTVTPLERERGRGVVDQARLQVGPEAFRHVTARARPEGLRVRVPVAVAAPAEAQSPVRAGLVAGLAADLRVRSREREGGFAVVEGVARPGEQDLRGMAACAVRAELPPVAVGVTGGARRAGRQERARLVTAGAVGRDRGVPPLEGEAGLARVVELLPVGTNYHLASRVLHVAGKAGVDDLPVEPLPGGDPLADLDVTREAPGGDDLLLDLVALHAARQGLRGRRARGGADPGRRGCPGALPRPREPRREGPGASRSRRERRGEPRRRAAEEQAGRLHCFGEPSSS